MAADVESAGVAAETRGIFVGPGNSTPHLFRHDADVTIRRAHRSEIERDVIYTGIDEKLGREAVVLRFSAKPSATMYEHEDRRIGFLGRIQIQRFDRRRSV